jgi:hypothetical protein
MVSLKELLKHETVYLHPLTKTIHRAINFHPIGTDWVINEVKTPFSSISYDFLKIEIGKNRHS